MMEGIGRRLGTKNGSLVNIGHHSLNGRERNVLFRNNGNETFTDVAWVNGADRIEDGRGLALIDADRNGSVDLMLRNYRMPAGILVNHANEKHHWISFELEGTTSNRDAVGARLRMRTGDAWQTRVVTSGSGYISSSSLRQHFGLGAITHVDELVIEWPSGGRSVLLDLAPDRHYEIREGSDQMAVAR